MIDNYAGFFGSELLEREDANMLLALARVRRYSELEHYLWGHSRDNFQMVGIMDTVPLWMCSCIRRSTRTSPDSLQKELTSIVTFKVLECLIRSINPA